MHLKKSYAFLFFFLLFISYSAAQKGIVSGVLEDETGPIPGVNIFIKGTTEGTQTDFDGNYSINCTVGDILRFTYIGMKTKEVKVTSSMFGVKGAQKKFVSVPIFTNSDYANALRLEQDSVNPQKITGKTFVYNKNKGNLERNRIKDITEEGNKINLRYFKPDTYYKIKFNTAVSFRYVPNNALVDLQNTFVQGRPLNGVNRWFGPETNEVFSYGPATNRVVFNGDDYKYDVNGRLITGENGTILPYTNDLFKTSKIIANNLNIGVSNKNHLAELKLRRKSQEDLFNFEKGNLTQLNLNYVYKKKFRFFFKYNNAVDKQPDQNGFYSNLLLSSYLTPTSFKNSQGYVFSDHTQRSFSPNNYNNPLWLLHLNNNRKKAKSLLYGAKSKFYIGEGLNVSSIFSFHKKTDNLRFALPTNTVGFINGYASIKDFSEDTFDGYLALNYSKYLDFANIEIETAVKYVYNTLDYSLLEQSNFSVGFSNPSNENLVFKQLKNNIVRFSNEIKLDLEVGFDADIIVKNNMASSSLQGTELFLPAAKLYVDISDILGYSNWINRISIAAGIAKEAKEGPLYYANQSHNSLLITPEQSLSFLANNDLFNAKELDYERATNFDIETSIRLFNKLNFGVNYFYSKSQNNIFPVVTNGIFKLENVAAIKNEGIEASLDFHFGNWRDFQYTPTFLFSKNKAKVLSLVDGNTSIPIAGFSTVSKNLIVGEQTGAIVGSAFLRNANNQLIIDNEGFPIVASEKKIIGNTTPDFNLSMNNNFKIGKVKINFLVDYQHGGSVWNGTKNVLNYTGRSQETAKLRGTTNYIFNGVDALGNPNTIAVDFANPNLPVSANRWVRYGYSGVDEEAIEDGSFINLKTVSVSYDFASNSYDEFFRQLEISFYAYNLFTYTKADGITPYSSLFNYSAASGLDYFNTPLVKEIGLKINIKI